MGMVKQDDRWRLPDEMWEQMVPLLPPRKPHPLGCHNPRVPDRSAMNAIFFVLRTGCQWNSLNATGICSSTSAYRRFREWLDAGVFEQFWRLGWLAADALEEIDWSWLSLDGAMTKAPLGGEKIGSNPTDRGKGGVKRSWLTEAHGIPLAIVMAGANRQDMKLVKPILEDLPLSRPLPTAALLPQGLCLDKRYDYGEVRALVAEFGFTAHIRSRGEEASQIKREASFRARRWVVERTHSWMNRFRQILVRWEKLAKTYLAFLHLACAIITWRATGLLE
jgi:putative transposase